MPIPCQFPVGSTMVALLPYGFVACVVIRSASSMASTGGFVVVGFRLCEAKGAPSLSVVECDCDGNSHVGSHGEHGSMLCSMSGTEGGCSNVGEIGVSTRT